MAYAGKSQHRHFRNSRQDSPHVRPTLAFILKLLNLSWINLVDLVGIETSGD